MYTVPFDSEVLKKIITGQEQSPVIDYKNSKLKNKNILTYFSNLKYKNLTIDFSGVSYEEKQELLVDYIKHQSTVNIEQLVDTLVRILFHFRGFDLKRFDDSIGERPSILTIEEVQKFVATNESLVAELTSILDSVVLYAVKNLNEYKKNHGDSIGINVIQEKQEVGKTFVNVFQNEDFNCHYYAVLPDFSMLAYYEHYFDRPIYSGKTLMNYISSGSLLYALIMMAVNNDLSETQLEELKNVTLV